MNRPTSFGRRIAPDLLTSWEPAAEPEPFLSDDVRLFLTGWFGGLVFFGTLLS